MINAEGILLILSMDRLMSKDVSTLRFICYVSAVIGSIVPRVIARFGFSPTNMAIPCLIL